MAEIDDKKFALFAELEGLGKLLIAVNLSLARLFDDVVVPYQTDESFFIDGAPLTREKIKRIKILKQETGFDHAFIKFNSSLTKADIKIRKVYGANTISG